MFRTQHTNIQLQQLVNYMGENTVIGFCETWLTENNEKKLWEFSPKIFKTFRTDRNKTCSIKTKGGGVMILVPKHLNPKERPDLNQIDPAYFESLWVECNLPGNGKTRQLINISYCPQKSLKVFFIEQLACSIDKAITENLPITLMGDFNLNYLSRRARDDLDTILVSYNLAPKNTTLPTRVH